MTSETVKRLADKYMMGTADRLPPRPRRPDPPDPEPAPAIDGMPDAGSDTVPRLGRLSERKKTELQKWGLVALYVAGPNGPVPRGIGDNRLGWPLRIGSTRAASSARLTRDYDYFSPYHWQGVWLRVWTQSEAHQGRLAEHVRDLLLRHDPEAPAGTIEGEIARWAHWQRADDLERHRWLDVGPTPDFFPWLRDAAIEEDLGLKPLPSDADREARRERRFRITCAKLERAIRKLADEHVIETWTDAALRERLDIWEAAEAQREVGPMTKKGR